RVAAGKAACLPGKKQERRLANIFGVLIMMEQAQGHAHDHVAMAPDQRRERLLIALLDKAADKIVVRRLLLALPASEVADDPQNGSSLFAGHTSTSRGETVGRAHLSFKCPPRHG